MSGIVQHSSGRLIINIESNGFVEFDGLRFRQRHYEPNFENLFVHYIFEDRQDDIWLCTSQGLYLYHPEEMEFFPFPENVGKVNNVFDMKQGNDDEYYLCTQNGIITFDKEKYQRINIDTTLFDVPEIRVFDMVPDFNGKHLLGTNNGLFYMKDDLIYRIHDFDVEDETKILVMDKDRDGNIWLGRTGGADVIQVNGSIVSYEFIQDNQNSLIEIYEKSDGRLLLGTTGDGMYEFDGSNFKRYSDENGMSNNYVWSITEDNEGNVWIGTSGGGLDKFVGEQFTAFTKADGLINNIVYSIIEDSKKNIWFGVVQGGISVYDG